MNWLIISDNIEETEKARELIGKKFKDSIVYAFTSDSIELKSSFEILPQISQTMILSNQDNPVVSFIAGCLCGKEVPVYVASLWLEKYMEIFSNFHFFDGAEKLFAHLSKNSSKIIAEEVRKSAFAYLFENGIPFDTDHFAEHLIFTDKDEEKRKINSEILECYLAAGIDINGRDKDGTPMLNVACRAEKLDAVKWLVELGADINAVSEDRGYTALMDSVWKGNKEIAEFLIEKHAELNTVSKEGQSNLILAVGADKVEIVRLLAENGADPDIADGMGMSAYGYAQLFKKSEILEILEKYHKE